MRPVGTRAGPRAFRGARSVQLWLIYTRPQMTSSEKLMEMGVCVYKDGRSSSSPLWAGHCSHQPSSALLPLPGATLSPTPHRPSHGPLLSILTLPQEQHHSNGTAPGSLAPRALMSPAPSPVSGRDPVICPHSPPRPGTLPTPAELTDVTDEGEDGGRPISALLDSSLTCAGAPCPPGSSGPLPPLWLRPALHRRPRSRGPGLCEEAAVDANLLL